MINESCPKELIDFAHRVADAVGEVHRRYFRQPVAIAIKDDGSPVTEADKESELVVREMVGTYYPEHGVIGEEFPSMLPEADYVWVVDPIDGTQLFLSGKPLFGLLLALAYKGRFILGVIDHAVLGERWLGADGFRTIFNGDRIRTRECTQLAQASLYRPGKGAHTLGRDTIIDRIAGQAATVQWGLSPYDYGLLSSGYIDAIINSGPKLHDIAALDPVIRNAGGAVVDWDGRLLSLASPDHILAAGDPRLIDQMLAHVSGDKALNIA
jgi:inositol-phosphate phosphatase/L-galactose 1-phosphate phosphatase/histidinol-phosphatase